MMISVMTMTGKRIWKTMETILATIMMILATMEMIPVTTEMIQAMMIRTIKAPNRSKTMINQMITTTMMIAAVTMNKSTTQIRILMMIVGNKTKATTTTMMMLVQMMMKDLGIRKRNPEKSISQWRVSVAQAMMELVRRKSTMSER